MKQKVDQISLALQRLVVEFQHDRQNAQREHEMQQLRLENILLRFERGLPPESNPESDES